MRLLPLGLVCIMLAACVPVSTAPAVGDVLPVEAQRVIDRATATAGAVATQNAQATATSQTARETSTAAALGTLGALAARQTEAGVSMTLGAANAEFTQGAAQNSRNLQASETWSTPTAAAMRAQATAQALDNAARRAQAENMGEFWQTLRTVLVALLIVAGLAWIAVTVIDRVSATRVAALRERASIAREAFRLLPPGHWAEWAPDQGYQVYQLPGPSETGSSVELVIENAASTPNTAHEWRQAVRLFCWWGDRYGFGIRELGPTGAGVVSDPDWRVLSKMLKGAGVLAEVAIPGKKGKATGWAPEWGYTRLHDELGHGPLALPFPTDTDAPKVAYTVPNTTPQQGQHNTATQKESARP